MFFYFSSNYFIPLLLFFTVLDFYIGKELFKVKIVTTKNDVNTVLFTTPLHDDYFKKFSKFSEQKIYLILETVSNKFHLDLYSLTHSIPDKTVFRSDDYVHETKKLPAYVKLLVDHILHEHSTNYLAKIIYK